MTHAWGQLLQSCSINTTSLTRVERLCSHLINRKKLIRALKSLLRQWINWKQYWRSMGQSTCALISQRLLTFKFFAKLSTCFITIWAGSHTHWPWSGGSKWWRLMPWKKFMKISSVKFCLPSIYHGCQLDQMSLFLSWVRQTRISFKMCLNSGTLQLLGIDTTQSVLNSDRLILVTCK